MAVARVCGDYSVGRLSECLLKKAVIIAFRAALLKREMLVAPRDSVAESLVAARGRITTNPKPAECGFQKRIFRVT